MKKFLLSAALVACASVAAQADSLYATGNFAASNWDPANPVEIPFDGTNYVGTIEGVSQFKLSTTFGDWDLFNEGCVMIDTDATLVGEGTFNLMPGDGNIALEWESDWTITVSADLGKITLKANTAKPAVAEIYLRGGMNEWGTDPDWMFSTEDGITYTLRGVVIEEGVEFKVADGSWGSVNYGVDAGVAMYLDEPTELIYNAQNIVLDYEGATVNAVDCVFDLDSHVFSITSATGAELISTDNAPAVYFNLQGVQVANPANGLYIVKRGDKASKVLVK